VISINAREDDRFKSIQSISNLGLRSVLAVPFKVQDEVVGAVYVDNRLAKGVFNEDDQKLVEAFADQAAIAIKQATLLKELNDTNSQLKDANERAQSLADELKKRVAVQEVELAEARARLRAQDHGGGSNDYSRIVGRSRAMQDVFRMLDRLVASDFPVLIQGESGVGKELVARAIHDNSTRRAHRFVSRTARRCPTRCSRASCSATRRARSPAPRPRRRVCSRWPITALCSSTRWGT
jgi:Nif-specific regulatory protein